jgi:hypothetical protein
MTAKKTDNFLKRGRPTKYNEDMIEIAEDYIQNHLEKYKDVIPMVEGLAIELGVAPTTIYEWEKIYPDFSNTVRGLMTSQGRSLMNGALNGTLKEKTAGLLLGVNHGMIPKTATDIMSSDGSMQPTVIEIVAYGEDDYEDDYEEDKSTD